MGDTKLEELVGEIVPTGPRKEFNVKPYLSDFYSGMLMGIIGNVGQHLFSPEPSPLTIEYTLFFFSKFYWRDGLTSIPENV